MDITIPVPDFDWYHIPIDLSDLSYIRFQWTPVYILTILWALSILARHGAAWLAGPRESTGSNGYLFASDGRPDRARGTFPNARVAMGGGLGADAEQTRELLERQLDREMRSERLRMRHWRDRFAKGNQIARTVLLMLLGACIFTSVPIRYTCVNRPHGNKGDTSVGELQQLGTYFGNLAAPVGNYVGAAWEDADAVCDWGSGCNDGTGRHRDPPKTPKDPKQPREPPRRDIECFQCATNGITFATMLLSWIYLAIAVLWWVMELFIVESYGVGITRTIMSLLSFPLVVAMFAIGLGRWRHFAGLNRGLCELGV